MADQDRVRSDRDSYRPRDEERSGWEQSRRYETDYERDRRSEFARRDPAPSFGRGSRDDHGPSGWDAPAYGTRRAGGFGDERQGFWRDDRADRDDASAWRDPGRAGRYGGGGMERDRSDLRGRNLGDLAFGRDTSGRSDDDDRSYRSGRERGYGDDRQDRSFVERAGDEIASWFGDDDAERRRRQDRTDDASHRGRGPRSYQRSDERIRDDVNDRLTDDRYLDASDIEVAVAGREVTLSGTVRSRTDKRRAEDLAESISGVQHVQNNLRVGQAATSWSGTDPAAAGRAAPSAVSSTGFVLPGGRDDPKV